MPDTRRIVFRRTVLKSILRVALALIGVYVGFSLLVGLFQSRLVYFPLRTIDATPADAGLEYRDVTVTTSDGVRIHGWFCPADEERGVVLFCHGNGGNISGRLGSLEIFHNLGLSTLIFDYRGYGRSEGSPSEEGTYLDAEAVWRHLTEEMKIDPGRIILFGRSLGGAVAAKLATKHKPGAVILESSFTSIPDIGAEAYPFLPVRAICRFDYNTAESVGKIRCPVLIVHSVEDDLIPVSHGRKLFELANEPKRFLEIKGSHNYGFSESGAAYTGGLDGFISEVLGKAGAPGGPAESP